MKRVCLLFIHLLFSLSHLWGQAFVVPEGFLVIDMRDGLSENRIRQIRQMPDGRMAIATSATIDIYDGTRFTSYKLPPERAFPLPDFHGDRQLTCDSTGRIWLRHDRQLYVVDSHKGRVEDHVDSLLVALHLSVADIVAWPKDSTANEYAGISHVKAVVHDSYGGLWVGTKENGILYRNAHRLRQFHTFADSAFVFDRQPNFCSPRASQLSARYAPSATNCTLERKTGYTYLGTRNGLMIIDNADRLVATLDEQDGLSTNNIYALISDAHGDVWATTANGITRIHTAGRDSFDITNYGRMDGIRMEGLEFRTCQIHRDSSDLVTVGFVGGIITFHPDSITARRYTFHYPRPQPTETIMQSVSSASFHLLWLIPACLLLLLLLWLVVLSRRHRQHADAAVKTSPVSTDSLIEQLKASPTQETIADEQFLSRLQTVIEANIGDEDFSVQTLSEQMAMDRTGLYRRLQTLTGLSPSVYIKRIRMDVAARLLRETDLPIADIAVKTGFSTTKYFNRVFKEETGASPAEYRVTHVGAGILSP